MKHWALYVLFLVTVTAYNPNGTKADVGYLGHKVVPNKTVAVSHDLKHLLGCEILIEGVGWRFVNDLTASNWKKRIDLCLPSKGISMEFGKQKSRILKVSD